MNRCLSLIVLLLCALPALAEFSGLPDGVKANLTAIKKYPKASSILLRVSDAYTQNDDGTQIYEHHEFRYLPDEAARDLCGDPHIAYVDGRQKIDIITARSYTSDGRTIDATPENAFNPITPEGLDHAPEFSQFRQLVVTLLGLENGSIAELHYRLTTEKPLYPWLWGRVYFREEVPTVSRELSVTVPEGKTLSYKADHGVSDPAVTGGSYVWRMGEQPGYLADDLSGHRVLLPNVAFSTAKDWPEVIGELRSRIQTASDEIAIPKSLASMLAVAMEPEGKLDSIKAWMRERFNELEFEHPDFMLTIRPVSQVLNSGYGNSLELAALSSTFCAKAGLSSAPAAWYAFEPPVPYLYDLTGGLLVVVTEAEEIIGDPIAAREEFTAADMADATTLLLGSETILQPLPPVPPEDLPNGEFRINLTMDALGADTLRGVGTLFAKGWQTPYEGIRSDPKAHLEHLMEWPGLSIGSVTVRRLGSRNTQVDFSVTAAALDTVDGHRLLPTSALKFAQFAGNPNVVLERREFPHWVKLPGKISVHWEASIPEDWTVSQQPSALSRTWKGGSGTRTVEVTDGRIVIDETLTFSDVWIAPKDWGEFRSFLLETGDRANNIVVFSHKSD